MHNAYTGESDSSCQQIAIEIVGINNEVLQMKNEEFKLYPNPVNDELIVISEQLTVNTNAKIIITNSIGQIVFTNQCILTNKYPIDISNLSNGIYFVKINTGKSIVIQKVIKQ